MGHPGSHTMMSERDHTLGFSKAEGIGVWALVVGVVTSFAVMTVFSCWAIPDGVGRVELFAQSALVRKWEGPDGMANRDFFVMVLWHCVPP